MSSVRQAAPLAGGDVIVQQAFPDEGQLPAVGSLRAARRDAARRNRERRKSLRRPNDEERHHWTEYAPRLSGIAWQTRSVGWLIETGLPSKPVYLAKQNTERRDPGVQLNVSGSLASIASAATAIRAAASLEELGLGQYAKAFAEQAIDFEIVPALSDAYLESLGMITAAAYPT
jgi:SAM domain (Sterile alpha motif)